MGRTAQLATCEICANSFLRHSGKACANRFCSRSCYLVDHAKKPRIKRVCSHCEKSYECPIFKANRKPYCSEACWKAHKKAKPIHCSHCEVWFTPMKMMNYKHGKRLIGVNNRSVCSAECLNGFMRHNKERKRKISEAFTGTRHPNWQGGSRHISYRGVGWNKVANMVRDRAGHRCEKCGVGESETGRRLDVHHEIPFHQKGSNRASNLIALCKTCHTKADWAYRKAHAIQQVLL